MKTKIILSLVALMLCGAALSGKNPIVWDNPAVGYSNRSESVVAITKVELHPDSAVVWMHVEYPHGYWIEMGSNIFLRTEQGDYKVKNATVVELDKQFWMPESNVVDFAMTFEALPATVKNFDFIEPGGWIIRNVRDSDYRPEGIAGTYWRDDATGDWLIGFGKDVAVYKNRFWDIKELIEKKGSYTMTLVDGIESLPVKVSKMKNDRRRISVGDERQAECSIITGKSLPAYPQYDPKTGFKDTGYREGDSVTIMGWWKDMPREEWNHGNEWKLSIGNLITHNQDTYSCRMDSLGRFVLKMPLLNTSEVFVDWERSRMRTVLEPGETYFLLYDFFTGQHLIMGENSRLQNELLSFDKIKHRQMYGRKPNGLNHDELMELITEADSVKASELAELDRQIAEYPTLSQRYRDFVEGECNVNMGCDLMQMRFSAKRFDVPDEYFDFVNKEVWRKIDKPYTLHGSFSIFMGDFFDEPKTTNFNMADVVVFSLQKELDIISLLADEGKMVLTDSDRIVLSRMDDGAKVLKDSLNLLTDGNNTVMIQKMVDKVLADTVLRNKYNKIKTPYLTLIQNEGELYDYKETASILDSLTSDRDIRDLYLAKVFYERLENANQPLNDSELAYMEREVRLPVAKRVVREKNDAYLALADRDISAEKSLTVAKDVSGMSDGEQIMREIVAPYKGKIILVDVWGTWCGPCREAMSHFWEYNERLKPYDMVFIYLANTSPKEAWENVIKQYNLLGDNVVHYNLPEDQQAAVEQFLKVNSYPTYRLIDKDGNLLDVNADVRDLDSLETVLKQL